MNVKLPPEHQSKTIQGMVPGEEGWTYPWAITVDLDMTMWINAQYPVSRHPGGTGQLRIERCEAGVMVWRDGLSEYTPSGVWPFAGSDPAHGRMPVTALLPRKAG